MVTLFSWNLNWLLLWKKKVKLIKFFIKPLHSNILSNLKFHSQVNQNKTPIRVLYLYLPKNQFFKSNALSAILSLRPKNKSSDVVSSIRVCSVGRGGSFSNHHPRCSVTLRRPSPPPTPPHPRASCSADRSILALTVWRGRVFPFFIPKSTCCLVLKISSFMTVKFIH